MEVIPIKMIPMRRVGVISKEAHERLRRRVDRYLKEYSAKHGGQRRPRFGELQKAIEGGMIAICYLPRKI